jgi:hypothetical protein
MMTPENKKLFDEWFEAKYKEFEQYPPRLLISLIEMALQILHTKLDEEAVKKLPTTN